MTLLVPRETTEIAPGAVHIPDWLSSVAQAELAQTCQRWSQPPGGMFSAKVRSGVMSVQTVCLGWHWLPYRYSRVIENGDGTTVKPFPTELTALGKAAVAASGLWEPEAYEPDAALINFYDAAAKMGMHQDKDERSDAPVVSISIGNTAMFRFGNAETRTKPYTDVALHSGDLVVFGGPSRLAFHGITKTLPGTADPDLAMPVNGRWNITLRMTGL
jgi:DNA oxidative demethylase